MYTDGITESRNPSGNEFGDSRLIDLVLDSRSTDATALTGETIAAATEFSNGNFDDDLTVVAISVD
jgi:serine phosphatase RsbU (regulator of sigma subunit)